MKVKNLIARLEKLPKNAQVFVWEGFNMEYLPKIKIKEVTVGRIKYEGEKPDAWADNIPAFIPKKNRQYKKAVCIQGVNSGRKVDMR
jgi:hypothetical protein